MEKFLFLHNYRYVAFISGLNFGEQNQDCLQLQMFVDLLTGQLGSIQVNTAMYNSSSFCGMQLSYKYAEYVTGTFFYHFNRIRILMQK